MKGGKGSEQKDRGRLIFARNWRLVLCAYQPTTKSVFRLVLFPLKVICWLAPLTQYVLLSPILSSSTK